VREPGGDADLARDPLGAERRGELRAQQLERHPTSVAQILRQVHDRHAAPPELPLDDVPPDEWRARGGRARGHDDSSEGSALAYERRATPRNAHGRSSSSLVHRDA
jgi:hypothetical protein